MECQRKVQVTPRYLAKVTGRVELKLTQMGQIADAVLGKRAVFCCTNVKFEVPVEHPQRDL